MKNIYSFLLVLLLLFSCNSATVKFGTLVDPLPDNVWDNSQWISAVNAPVITDTVIQGTLAPDGANWFVSKVKNSKKVISAKWMTAGLGVYELYLNGKIVGEEILKPGFTHYEKTKRSFTYDLTEAFRCKADEENILSIQITPGWWGDKTVTPTGHLGMIGHKCAFRGVLELTYKDGTKEYLGTDTQNWKAGIAGAVKHAAIYDGEFYDARELPGYETMEKLSTPEINTEFNGEILPTNGAEIYLRKDLTLDPVRAYIWKDIEGATDDSYGKVVVDREYNLGDTITLHAGENLVVDFGQNCAAVPYFDFQAAEGTTLTCLVSELVNDGNGARSRGMDGPEGSIHRLNLRIPTKGMKLEYTFGNSESACQYYPHFTFFGYRLISVSTTSDVTINRVQSIPVSSITDTMEIGSITTGNELINKLISNTVWSERSNYLSVPTDCPQRDERLGWTADTQVFATTGAYFANTNEFFHKWLRDLRDTQSEKGAYPGVAPWGQYGTEQTSMMRVGWADAGVIVPWSIWRQFGDNTIIEESWESMEKYMNHVAESKYKYETLADESGHYQWADWLSYEPLETCEGKCWCPEGVLPEAKDYWSYLGASYWVLDAEMMLDMANSLGRDTKKYVDMIAEAKAYIKETFLTNESKFKTEVLNTMQTPNLFLLKNKIVDGGAKEAVIARLRENFKAHDNCLQTGFLGTSILMNTLTENGMTDIAYNLLFQRKNPSWLYSVDNGATTIWERWNSYTLKDGMGPRGMNSFNHYAYGVVCQWLWESAAGISPDVTVPGYKHIIMKPIPDKRLGSIKAEYQSAAGLIKSEWAYNGDVWEWTFTIPAGSTASVTLPGETESKEYKAGTYTLSK